MKKSHRRWIAGILLPTLMILGLSGCGGREEVAEPKLSDLEKSLFMITTEYSTVIRYPNELGQPRFSDPVSFKTTCTGWAAGSEGEIMTAGHCVEFNLDAKINALITLFSEQPQLGVDESEMEGFIKEALDSPHWAFLGVGQGDNEPDIVPYVLQNPEVEGTIISNIASPPVARVLAKQPFDNGDLALLKVDNLSKPTVPLAVATVAPEVGDEVTSIGYPGDLLDFADRSRERASFHDGTIQSNQTIGGVGSQQVSTNLKGGMSGGPSVNENFEVVGVNSFGLKGSETISFITNSKSLADFLEAHGIEVTFPQQPEENSVVMYLVIAAIAFVVLALLGLFFLLFRKRKKKSAAYSGYGAQQAYGIQNGGWNFGQYPAQPPSPTNPLYPGEGESFPPRTPE